MQATNHYVKSCAMCAGVQPKGSAKAQLSPEDDPNTIHIFTVASGHMYERLQKIMILSVKRNTRYSIAEQGYLNCSQHQQGCCELPSVSRGTICKASLSRAVVVCPRRAELLAPLCLQSIRLLMHSTVETLWCVTARPKHAA